MKILFSFKRNPDNFVLTIDKKIDVGMSGKTTGRLLFKVQN